MTTATVGDITQTTAQCGGNVTSDGGATVTARGVCWSTSPSPTIADSKTTDGSGTGSFTSSLTGLTAGTPYYVRAYATNSAGTSYGSARSFTTTAQPTAPVVTTATVSAITQTTAVCGGSVTSDGGATVTARGVCWSTDPLPTVHDDHTTDGSGIGSYVSSLTGLSPATEYYVRAYAINEVDTGYGVAQSFTTTAQPTAPVVTTATVSAITQTTAVCGGSVTSDGGATVTARGVCWSTDPLPTVHDDHTTDGSGIGSYVSSLTGLSPATEYYVRAYAINEVDTGYGVAQSFTTTAQPTAPVVTTATVSGITQTTAVCGGNVTSDGGAAVTARGVCWSTDPLPTVHDDHTTDGSGIGSYVSSLTGLTAGTPYYVRAYATNSAGTSYGSARSFTTTAQPTAPVVTTATVSAITQTTAVCGGSVTSDGGATVTARGVCWSTDPLPTVHDDHTTDGSGIGSYVSSLTGLSPATEYYVRAYAINEVDTGYGVAQSFTTTAQPTAPVVTTATVSGITQTTAVCGGNVTSDGGAAVTARGVCWSTSSPPTIADSKTTDGSGTGSFTSSLTGLTAGTPYYVRAYATNSVGTSYGEERLFTTAAQPTAPVVTTAPVSGITQTTAVCGGNVTSDGGAAVTARGVCWSTSSPPTIADNKTTDGSGTGSFTSSLTGLTAGTPYYVRAYATNSVGTSYGEERSFTTAAQPTAPVVTTASVSDITQTTAQCGGNVTSDGGATVTARGVCWSTSSPPTIANSKTTDDSGTGSFTSSLTGLTAGTPYYVRAYATNSVGTGYGEVISFTTAAQPTAPVVTTAPVSGITQTTAVCGGNVTSDGGATVTARGVCWSTDPLPTVHDDHTTDGSGIGSYVSSLTGLSPATEYYVRAYAINEVDTGYGVVRSFTTAAQPTAPVVTTATVSGITQTTAVCGGDVTSDGGALVTARGVCWSTSSPPTIADSKTTDGSGTGSFTSSIAGLDPETTYYVRAYATNSVGTSYGEERSFTTESPVCSTVTDIDGNVYQTVMIGDQCWMAENLKVIHYRNGDPIPHVTDSGEWEGLSTGAYCEYDNDPGNVATYGRLYNWYATDDSRKIAPEGWHVPTDEEWKQLEMYLGMSQAEADGSGNRGTDEGGKLKESGTTHWNSPNEGATNESGFSALPGGYRDSPGDFDDVGSNALFWSSTEISSSGAWFRYLSYFSSQVDRYLSNKRYGKSVRCVRD